jgi:hypothetical protein
MRLKQPEIKQYRRNMIDPQKFTFQRQQMLAPRQPDDYTIHNDTIGLAES